MSTPDDQPPQTERASSATEGQVFAKVPQPVELVRARRYPLLDYLALHWPAARSIRIALGGLAALIIATDSTTYLLGRPLVPQLAVNVYRMSWLPGLLLAWVVLAPVGEEIIFRGFLYKGIAVSRAGPIGAVVITSIVFALLHVQYGWYYAACSGALGTYLGVVRYRAECLPLTMLLHGVSNAIGTLELVLHEHWLR
jgi:membrane protease YdiL (CAAX protease family)